MIFLCLALFALFLLFPEITGQGIRSGIHLAIHQVVPALYPFILLTTLLKYLSKNGKSRPLTLVAGFLSGYPLGAKVVAENFPNQALLIVCNNPSLAYMISYVGLQNLGTPLLGLIMYGVILIGNSISGIFFYIFSANKSKADPLSKVYAQNCLPLMIDQVFEDTFSTLLRICSYLMVASVGAAFIRQIPLFPPFIQGTLTGLFEMTSGIQILSPLDLPLRFKTSLLTGIISFGGLSILAQTASMIRNSKLSIKKYIIQKATASAIAFGIMYFVFTLLNIE